MVEPIEHKVTLEITCLRPPTWQGVFGLDDYESLFGPIPDLSHLPGVLDIVIAAELVFRL